MAAYEPKMAKRTVENCGATYQDPKSKNNCSFFSPIFHVEQPVSRYGRLKMKFLCERFSHCIYSFCSIELTKTKNTWSLTAVSNVVMKSNPSKGELKANCKGTTCQ